MFWRNLSISKKLFLAIALTSTLCIVLMALLVGWSMRSGFTRYVTQAELDRFDRLALALVDSYDPSSPNWPELSNFPRSWLEFTRSNLGRPPGPPRRARANRDERRVENSNNRPRPNRRPRDPLRLGNRLALLNSDGEHLAGAIVENGISAQRPLVWENADGDPFTIGWLALVALENRPLAADAVFLTKQRNNIIIASFLALVLSAVSALLLARQFNSPIQKLKRGTHQLASRNYSSQMKHDRGDEFGKLIDDFNILAKTLEAKEIKERQWLSDTSHELQTPLAVLRAGIEALQDGIRNPSQQNLAELHDTVMKLSRLVNDIRTLSQARENQLVGEKTTENLADILRECLKAFRPLLEEKGLEVKENISERIPIQCDRLRMKQVVDNLLENSRRYTTAPGKVLVSAGTKEGEISLIVEDSAPHPTNSAIANLFERFYRAEESRSRAYGGSGLGLSICKEIVEAHGGTIHADVSSLGGLKFHISLPITGLENDE